MQLLLIGGIGLLGLYIIVKALKPPPPPPPPPDYITGALRALPAILAAL